MWNVCVLVLVIFSFFAPASYAKDLAGEVVSVSGTAFIRQDSKNAGPTKAPQQIRPSDNIYAGDVINTSSEGSVKILMKDKSIVDIGASSLFKVDEYKQNNGNDRKAKLDLMYGRVRVAVTKKIEGKGKFEVKTRSATMGVRGTEFIVNTPVETTDAPKAKTEVSVVQGKVDVAQMSVPSAANGAPAAPPAMVSLTAGTQLTTGMGSVASAPVKLNETQMQSLNTENKIMDNTFAKAVTIEPVSNDSGNKSESGRSPSSSEGSSTSAALKSTMNSIAASPPPVVPVTFSELGLPGTFSVQNMVNTGPTNQVTMKRLSVTVVVGQ